MKSEEATITDSLTEFGQEQIVTQTEPGKSQFIKGPIPMSWMEQAAVLPGKALGVAMLLWYKRGILKEQPIRVSGTLLDRFEIGRKAGAHALNALEQQGLIKVLRRAGCAAMVRIIVPERKMASSPVACDLGNLLENAMPWTGE